MERILRVYEESLLHLITAHSSTPGIRVKVSRAEDTTFPIEMSTRTSIFWSSRFALQGKHSYSSRTLVTPVLSRYKGGPCQLALSPPHIQPRHLQRGSPHAYISCAHEGSLPANVCAVHTDPRFGASHRIIARLCVCPQWLLYVKLLSIST